jgi:MarR family transcriptional regulator for hemolysin
MDAKLKTRSEILELMTTVSRKTRTLFNARVRETGLTLARARTLLRIARSGAANQRELAEELEIETATLVRLIDGLETQGLIERCSVEGDRRAKQVVLTREGTAEAKLVDGMVDRIREEVLSEIGDADLQLFHSVLKRMAGNLEAIALEPTE